MADYTRPILTDAGRRLQAQAQIGRELNFTRFAFGSGAAPAVIEAMTALVDERQTVGINRLEVPEDGTARVRGLITNAGLVNGFFMREVGLFAADPDDGPEVLYAYSNAAERPDYLPAEGGPTLVEQSFELITIIGNAAHVTAVLSDSLVLVTQDDLAAQRSDLMREIILTRAQLARACVTQSEAYHSAHGTYPQNGD